MSYQPFLTAVVTGRQRLSSRLVRVTIAGPDLAQLGAAQPAASVRLLVPSPGAPDRIDVPDWDGQRFVGTGGGRPALRTVTPRHHDPVRGQLSLDVVTHGRGLVSTWAATAEVGSPAAVSGPARGHEIDPAAECLVIGGDETAYGAVCSLIEAAGPAQRVIVYLETAPPGLLPLPAHPDLSFTRVAPLEGQPGRAVADRLGGQELDSTVRLWAAGEAAAMQRLRRRLFGERQVPRAHATVRGYWKYGRSSDDAGGD
ncbi:MAG: siderophore-interacting protein [Actinomycetota bacterium]|nr:siderophore-interacting protein [Actinomycetota bacterium]